MNKSVAPSNEVLIKSRNKPSFVVLFRTIIHPFGTYLLKENNLAVVLNAITTSLVRLLENPPLLPCPVFGKQYTDLVWLPPWIRPVLESNKEKSG